MIIIVDGDVGGLHLDDWLSIFHGIAPVSHGQHPQVIFVITKGRYFACLQVKVFLQQCQGILLRCPRIADQVGIEAGVLHDERGW